MTNRTLVMIPALWLGASWMGTVSEAGAAMLLGPTPYLCVEDSPFHSLIEAELVFLEDFEDGALSTPGVSASTGNVIGPGGLTDSVDCDTGQIDGSGTDGRSFFSGSGFVGIRFTFDAAVLGRLPTHAGIVWTDGWGEIRFEAFDADGVSLGTLTGDHAGPTITGETDEDRFYGVIHEGGVSSIHISNTQGGIEVDHLQYGGALLGDMNLDGTVDTGDVAPFVLALTSPQAYQDQFGIDPALVGDINQDGSFDTGDVAPFVQLLVGGGASVPEPGSLALLLVTGLVLMLRGRGTA